jgi:hypothetical protein
VVLHAVMHGTETILVRKLVPPTQRMRMVVRVLEPDAVLAELDRAVVGVLGHQGAPDLGGDVACVAASVRPTGHGAAPTFAWGLRLQVVSLDVEAQGVLGGFRDAHGAPQLAGHQHLRSIQIRDAAARQVQRAGDRLAARPHFFLAALDDPADVAVGPHPSPRQRGVIGKGNAGLVGET